MSKIDWLIDVYNEIEIETKKGKEEIRKIQTEVLEKENFNEDTTELKERCIELEKKIGETMEITKWVEEEIVNCDNRAGKGLSKEYIKRCNAEMINFDSFQKFEFLKCFENETVEDLAKIDKEKFKINEEINKKDLKNKIDAKLLEKRRELIIKGAHLVAVMKFLRDEFANCAENKTRAEA